MVPSRNLFTMGCNKVAWSSRVTSGRVGVHSRLCLVFLETCASQTTLSRLVLHERFPDESRTKILCHEQGDTSIDPDDIAVVPLGKRVKRVHKSVLTPSLGIAIFDRAQDAHHGLRQKR